MKNESFLYEAPPDESAIIITADHATNIVPAWINGGDLGVSDADMNRHIAYDIGTLGVARGLAQQMSAHLIATQFSRLVIDPNRGEIDPTLIMKIYDRSLIPANRDITPEERETRLNRLYRPYHNELGALLGRVKASGVTPIIIAIHSFTPQLRGREPRPWHIGILSAKDRRIGGPLIQALEAEGDLVVGDNQPYKGALKGDTLDQHGVHNGLPHALIEIRNDLIETETQQNQWATRLALLLKTVLQTEGFHT